MNCLCGCGEIIHDGRKFRRGHNNKFDNFFKGKNLSAAHKIKISKSHKGISLSKEHKLNISKSHVDFSMDKHPMWNKGYLLKGEKKGKVCDLCDSKCKIIVHHKDENKKNHKFNNLQVLCRSCHDRIHSLSRSQ